MTLKATPFWFRNTRPRLNKAEKKALQERYNDISQMAFEAFATYYLCDGILEEMLEDHPFLAPARAIQEQVKN